jgi:hypothetical protein
MYYSSKERGRKKCICGKQRHRIDGPWLPLHRKEGRKKTKKQDAVEEEEGKIKSKMHCTMQLVASCFTKFCRSVLVHYIAGIYFPNL